MTFQLFEFQQRAADQMKDAALAWNAQGELPRYVRQVIPFLGRLTAITGAGKTPILASVVGGLGPAVILWTTKNTVVADQAVDRLTNRYRSLLPPVLSFLRGVPTADEWRRLIDERVGTTIWVLTAASWNERAAPAGGSPDARLRLRRPQPDWAGTIAPWDQLRDPEVLRRPLWVVYDESHGQTGVQLDQLLALNPLGVLEASGTPIASVLLSRMRAAVAADPVFGPILGAGTVEVSTADVVRAGLLKSRIIVDDFETETEAMLTAVVEQHVALSELADRSGAGVTPRAVFVVEESNAPSGEHRDARPLAIWRFLSQRRSVPTAAIAIGTDTRGLPPDAEYVKEVRDLLPRHRYLIFNKRFEEGWDDPEAYSVYFDGPTKIEVRIRQIIGRILRQPNATPFDDEELNTAHIAVRCPNDQLNGIVERLRASLAVEYGSDDTGQSLIDVIAGKARQRIDLRDGLPELSLPSLVLRLRMDEMADVALRIETDGNMPWPAAALDAEGKRTTREIDLRDPAAQQVIERQTALREGARQRNRDFFDDRLRALDRQARALLPPSELSGPMFDQFACMGSVAQVRLRELATYFADAYSTRVHFGPNPDQAKDRWLPQPFDAGQALVEYQRSIHVHYRRRDFNADEREVADALEQQEGWWMRNPPRAPGFAVPLPAALGSSRNFYPDFIWWTDAGTWALETTGRYLLQEKIQLKLFALENPRTVLVVRGRVSDDWQRSDLKAGWTLVRRRPEGRPRPEHFVDLRTLLTHVRSSDAQR